MDLSHPCKRPFCGPRWVLYNCVCDGWNPNLSVGLTQVQATTRENDTLKAAAAAAAARAHDAAAAAAAWRQQAEDALGVRALLDKRVAVAEDNLTSATKRNAELVAAAAAAEERLGALRREHADTAAGADAAKALSLRHAEELQRVQRAHQEEILSLRDDLLAARRRLAEAEAALTAAQVDWTPLPLGPSLSHLSPPLPAPAPAQSDCHATLVGGAALQAAVGEKVRLSSPYLVSYLASYLAPYLAPI